MQDVPLDDRLPRAIGIPAFGVGIPLLTGLYGPSWPGSGLAATGQVLFLALAAAIWHGNRALLFRTARLADWLERPGRRVALLLVGIASFTAPLTIATLALWYRVLLRTPIDWDVVTTVTLANVICVIFVTHVYETVLLIKGRAESLVREERLERARVESELLALRRQVDPHFLFNCLNTLQQLIGEDPAAAIDFNRDLAGMLRYLLSTGDKALVSVSQELDFLERYRALLRHRFGDAVDVVVIGSQTSDLESTAIPPTAIQLLVENAVKHNGFTRARPLTVTVTLGKDAITVSNPRRPKAGVVGAALGLQNLRERVARLGRPGLLVEDRDDVYAVTVPLGP